MTVKIVTAITRGCGRRKEGGNYIMAGGMSMPCHRLPFAIPVCPCCGETIMFFRGAKFINPQKLFRDCQSIRDGQAPLPCFCGAWCAVCHPPERGWIMWVGSEYTMESFTLEAMNHGVYKRIATFPTDMKVGDWIFMAFKHGYQDKENLKVWHPLIFHASKITEFQHLLTDKQAKDEKYIEELETRGITPVIEVEMEPEP